ncbi:adenylyltransferase/cytidyltransferase family protein (plasmid) [Rhodococcus pyridinivorans]|uniref:adenylyltransferase/cytidyltransferase family protein n=1 Tax=Rhodococcus pyridinivorans TaxID=103816 RepID=UPI001C3067AE|nr:adenylyltransferase/cytidyltransferase family protein [Rhodococcus pyridinivorans]QXF84285.1 adenylyltransferase/cytidyltransferase family protein [Rhodococcus pyridinivorans]
MKYGIVLGRFQPLHLGHVEYLDAAKRCCERLFIGITNPDNGSGTITESDAKRSLGENNPFSYIDRHLMIERALLDLGWSPKSFCLMAAPITDPTRLTSYLPAPELSEFFVTIYDEWGEQKAREIAALGYTTTTLWRRSHGERFTSGTFVRNAMRNGEPWEHLVPAGVASYINERGLAEVVEV